MDDQSILAGYIREDKFATAANISLRTSARYRGQPDGLPFLEFGGRIYIPIDAAREPRLSWRLTYGGLCR